MDLPHLIKRRLTELSLDQKDLAAAAEVTESYISQLLARKKAPPAPNRTDLYDKLGDFLNLPSGQLARLAEEQRQAERKRKLEAPPAPLFQACRELILRKCHPDRRAEVGRIFARDIFGELERLVTQRVLDVAQAMAREELRNEAWLRQMAKRSNRSYKQMRVAALEFLDTDVLQVSLEGCVSFLEPMIQAWDIDLRTFRLDITLNTRLAPGSRKSFEFREVEPEAAAPEPEEGLVQFLEDKTLSGDASPQELEFLRALRFTGRRPSALYYYRELQSLRDPLHFRSA